MNNIDQQEAQYMFRIKEGGEGTTPHIALEPFGGELPLFKNNNANPFFTLPAGTTLEKANQIAEFMTNNLASFGYFRLG